MPQQEIDDINATAENIRTATTSLLLGAVRLSRSNDKLRALLDEVKDECTKISRDPRTPDPIRKDITAIITRIILAIHL